MEQEFTEFSKFRESDISLKHELGSIKCPVSHKFFAGTVVASWSYTRGGWVAGLNPSNVMRNIFVTEFSEFGENIQGKLKYYTTQFWKYKHLSYSCTPLCVPVRLGQNLVFGKIFAENCMKRK